MSHADNIKQHGPINRLRRLEQGGKLVQVTAIYSDGMEATFRPDSPDWGAVIGRSSKSSNSKSSSGESRQKKETAPEYKKKESASLEETIEFKGDHIVGNGFSFYDEVCNVDAGWQEDIKNLLTGPKFKTSTQISLPGKEGYEGKYPELYGEYGFQPAMAIKLGTDKTAHTYIGNVARPDEKEGIKNFPYILLATDNGGLAKGRYSDFQAKVGEAIVQNEVKLERKRGGKDGELITYSDGKVLDTAIHKVTAQESGAFVGYKATYRDKVLRVTKTATLIDPEVFAEVADKLHLVNSGLMSVAEANSACVVNGRPVPVVTPEQMAQIGGGSFPLNKVYVQAYAESLLPYAKTPSVQAKIEELDLRTGLNGALVEVSKLPAEKRAEAAQKLISGISQQDVDVVVNAKTPEEYKIVSAPSPLLPALNMPRYQFMRHPEVPRVDGISIDALAMSPAAASREDSISPLPVGNSELDAKSFDDVRLAAANAEKASKNALSRTAALAPKNPSLEVPDMTLNSTQKIASGSKPDATLPQAPIVASSEIKIPSALSDADKKAIAAAFAPKEVTPAKQEVMVAAAHAPKAEAPKAKQEEVVLDIPKAIPATRQEVAVIPQSLVAAMQKKLGSENVPTRVNEMALALENLADEYEQERKAIRQGDSARDAAKKEDLVLVQAAMKVAGADIDEEHLGHNTGTTTSKEVQEIEKKNNLTVDGGVIGPQVLRTIAKDLRQNGVAYSNDAAATGAKEVTTLTDQIKLVDEKDAEGQKPAEVEKAKLAQVTSKGPGGVA